MGLLMLSKMNNCHLTVVPAGMLSTIGELSTVDTTLAKEFCA